MLQACFYTCIEADGNLGTDFADEAEHQWRVIYTHTDDQCWYAVGLPFAFLVQMAEATGESEFREAVQSYFSFQENCKGPWDGGSSGKAGWGCSMLYRITGENKYRDIALYIASRFASEQQSDGSWISGGKDTGTLTNADFDATAELSLWLALIAANVATRDSSNDSSRISL